jgi:hypothetical protein
MVNCAEFELEPSGARTVIVAVPAGNVSVAGIWAISWLLLPNDVGRLLPFHCTAELETKPEPFTVSVNADPFHAVVCGEILVTVGPAFEPGADPPPHAVKKQLKKNVRVATPNGGFARICSPPDNSEHCPEFF